MDSLVAVEEIVDDKTKSDQEANPSKWCEILAKVVAQEHRNNCDNGDCPDIVHVFSFRVTIVGSV